MKYFLRLLNGLFYAAVIKCTISEWGVEVAIVVLGAMCGILSHRIGQDPLEKK